MEITSIQIITSSTKDAPPQYRGWVPYLQEAIPILWQENPPDDHEGGIKKVRADADASVDERVDADPW